MFFIFFFFPDPPPTEFYPLSLHDALPICDAPLDQPFGHGAQHRGRGRLVDEMKSGLPRLAHEALDRSEEHTSELQSRLHLVCRLLLEKKKNNITVDRADEQPLKSSIGSRS